MLFTFPPSSFSFNIFHHNNILCRPCSIHYNSYFFIVANISSSHYSHGMPFQRFYIFSNLGMIQSSRALCTWGTSSKIGRLPTWKNAVIIRLTQKNWLKFYGEACIFWCQQKKLFNPWKKIQLSSLFLFFMNKIIFSFFMSLNKSRLCFSINTSWFHHWRGP